MGLFFKLNVFLLFVTSIVQCNFIDFKKAYTIFNERDSRSILEDNKIQFVGFMRNYEKLYENETELFTRLSHFNSNLDRLGEIQAKEKGTAKYGITKFSDYSADELQMYFGLKVPSDHRPTYHQARHLHYNDDDDDDEDINEIMRIPRQFDWTEKHVVTPVQNQGHCGSCWAFAAVGAVEAHHAIKTKELLELSKQQLLDCDSVDEGCSGGYMHTAFEYIRNAGGLQLDADYPYVAYAHHKEQCDNENPKVKVVSFRNVTGGEKKMKKYVFDNGPLTVAINANDISFYNEGVIDMDEWSCPPESLNHAVLIVGYGEEVNHDGLLIPYWIIKNSWGPLWGEKGYFKMRRGRNVCGIAILPTGVDTN